MAIVVKKRRKTEITHSLVDSAGSEKRSFKRWNVMLQLANEVQVMGLFISAKRFENGAKKNIYYRAMKMF